MIWKNVHGTDSPGQNIPAYWAVTQPRVGIPQSTGRRESLQVAFPTRRPLRVHCCWQGPLCCGEIYGNGGDLQYVPSAPVVAQPLSFCPPAAVHDIQCSACFFLDIPRAAIRIPQDRLTCGRGEPCTSVPVPSLGDGLWSDWGVLIHMSAF